MSGYKRLQQHNRYAETYHKTFYGQKIICLMLRYPVTKVVPFLPWREQIFLLWLSSSYQLWWWWDILLFFLTHFLFPSSLKKWLRHFGDPALHTYICTYYEGPSFEFVLCILYTIYKIFCIAYIHVHYSRSRRNNVQSTLL